MTPKTVCTFPAPPYNPAMSDDATILSVDELAKRIPDGAKLAIPADYSGVAMAATRALIRRQARDLHLVCVPVSGLQADMLIGAGAVATLETSAVSLGEYGPAPRFGAAVKAGSIRLLDATCPAIHAGLQAAQKGIPFMPLRGILGSDLLEQRGDWRTIQNPLSNAPDPLVLVSAIKPDIALFHAPKADRFGNVQIGRRRELVTMAHAAARTLVTVETLVDDDLMASEESAAGVLPALYVDAIAVAPGGTWPLGLWDIHPEDSGALLAYARDAQTAEGFTRQLAVER